GRPAGGDRRAAGASVLRRGSVPPRAEVETHAAPPAVPGVRRRGAGAPSGSRRSHRRHPRLTRLPPEPENIEPIFDGTLIRVVRETWPQGIRELVHHPGAAAVVP